MDIGFLGLGQMVVDDMADVGDIESAGRQVCAHQHVGAPVGKAIDRLLALPLVQSAMEAAHVEACLGQVVGHAAHGVAIVEEDHRLALAQLAEQLQQGGQLVALLASHLIY